MVFAERESASVRVTDEDPASLSALTTRRERAQGSRRILLSLLKNRMAVIGLVFLTVLILTAVAAPWVSPYDPLDQERSERLQGPMTRGEESGRLYLLGTDSLGRDLFSRIIHGSRISLLIGFLAVAVSVPLGVSLGVTAGYFGRYVEDVIMRVADVQLAFPLILLALSIIAVLGPSPRNIIIVLGVSGWVLYARVVRSLTLSISNQEFVYAARVVGGSNFRIMSRHILPNVLTPVIVLATFALAHMILVESSLSFLGLGVQPPAVTWGSLLSNAREYIAISWWMSIFPGLAIMLTILSVNFVGDWLRDFLDPLERDL